MDTTDTGKVALICSFIPFRDESAMIGLLKARSDLEMLVAIHCKSNKLSDINRRVSRNRALASAPICIGVPSSMGLELAASVIR